MKSGEKTWCGPFADGIDFEVLDAFYERMYSRYDEHAAQVHEMLGTDEPAWNEQFDFYSTAIPSPDKATGEALVLRAGRMMGPKVGWACRELYRRGLVETSPRNQEDSGLCYGVAGGWAPAHAAFSAKAAGIDWVATTLGHDVGHAAAYRLMDSSRGHVATTLVAETQSQTQEILTALLVVGDDEVSHDAYVSYMQSRLLGQAALWKFEKWFFARARKNRKPTVAQVVRKWRELSGHVAGFSEYDSFSWVRQHHMVTTPGYAPMYAVSLAASINLTNRVLAGNGFSVDDLWARSAGLHGRGWLRACGVAFSTVEDAIAAADKAYVFDLKV